jgi:hypothetical protein
MKQFLMFFCLTLGFLLQAKGQNQAAPQAAQASFASYSQEAYVIEQHSVKLSINRDGTGNEEEHARLHIQSEAGLQRYGVLVFPFASANSSVEVLSMQVLKANGTVISTPLTSVEDIPAEITRTAPFYSDLREKHVPVKGLAVGDTIDFRIRQQTHTPVIPGQFWYAYNFSKTDVVLDDAVDISVPVDMYLKVKSPDITPVVHK